MSSRRALGACGPGRMSLEGRTTAVDWSGGRPAAASRARPPGGAEASDHRCHALGLRAGAPLLALLELGQNLAAEQLEALHDVLVAVATRLAREDELVDAVLLVAAEVFAHLLRGADGAAEPLRVVEHDLGLEAIAVGGGGRDRRRVVAGGGPARLVLGPQIGPCGTVAAEDVV